MLHPPDISQASKISAVSLGWTLQNTRTQINKKSCKIFNRPKKWRWSFLSNKAINLTRKLLGQKSSPEYMDPLVGINTRQSGTLVHEKYCVFRLSNVLASCLH